ncbi:MAG: hypothetical protein KDA58_09875 [Planctomycetaceae bacterium]|nr:hypothetical protein [Planctomycetaceae bacterium]
MSAPRRLSLQLTPLLDLLLIVIFGQYLEVQSNQTAREQLIEQQAVQLQETEQALQQAAERHAQLESRQQRLGELVHEVFQIPSEEVNTLLDPFSSPAGWRSPQEREQLRQKFAELAAKSPEAAIQHLLTYEEIRKRCDLWSLHIDASGTILLTVDDEQAPVPILATQDERIDLDGLSAAMFARYKSLPEQKSLVLILLTYDRRSRVQLTRAVRQVLPVITAQMQTDAGGRSRYDFADLGFRQIP